MSIHKSGVVTAVAITLLCTSIARGTITAWKIDATQSTLTLDINKITAPANALFPGSPAYINGDIDLGDALGFQAQMSVRNEVSDAAWGTNPDPDSPAAPGNSTKIGGTISTSYVDSGVNHSIQFLSGAANGTVITAANGGNYAPNVADWNPSIPTPPFNGEGGFTNVGFSPGVFGAEAYIPQMSQAVGFLSQQNVSMDLLSNKLGISGAGTFAANQTVIGMSQSDLAFQSLTQQQNGITDFYNTGVNTSSALEGANTFSTGIIQNLGGSQRELAYNYSLQVFLDVGSLGGVNLVFPLIEHGTIVATATIAEPGDVNNDGVVNGLDINQIAGHWLLSGPSAADANGDGVVNGLDINLIAGNWLHSAGGGSGGIGAAVPEPSSLILGILAALGLALRRSRAC
ncbi:MAG TPA: dockerin type I domain-containing protein [Pirellulales bacterium]